MKKYLLKLFSHRTLALMRWDFYFWRISFLNILLFRKNRLKSRLNSYSQFKYLNLGSGPRGKNSNDWINIDGFNDENVHYLCDFNKRLPFQDETFDGIFCEHVLEHFDFNNGSMLLKECIRILKPNGIIRIVVPDGEQILKSYVNDPNRIINYKKPFSKLAMEAVNSWFYQRYEHQCIYDTDYLRYQLEICGFSKVEKTEFGSPAFDVTDIILDDKVYAFESLYMCAKK